MAVMLLAHYEIEDLDRFLEVFDGFAAQRRAAGALTAGLARSLDDPGTVVATIGFPTREQAAAFAASPERAEALRAAGVVVSHDELLGEVRPAAPD